MAKLSGGSKNSSSSKSQSYGVSGKKTGISLPSKNGSGSSSSYRPSGSSSSSYKPSVSSNRPSTGNINAYKPSVSNSGNSYRPSTSSGGVLKGSGNIVRQPASSNGSNSGLRPSGGNTATNRVTSSSDLGKRLLNSSQFNGSSARSSASPSKLSGLSARLAGTSSTPEKGVALRSGTLGTNKNLVKNTSKPNTNSKVLGAYTNVMNTVGKSPASAQKQAGNAKSGDSVQNKIPRRNDIGTGFKPILTPNSSGNIKSYSGGKMRNGVIEYPKGVQIDPGKAARAQAFVDYSYGESTAGRPDMGAIYGDAYYQELDRLARLPSGAPAWGTTSSGGKFSESNAYRDPSGGYEGSSGNGEDLMEEYRALIEAAERASREALEQELQKGLNSIYAQKDPLTDVFNDSAQQAFIAYMQGQKALPQQLSAQGLSGGATESANVALDSVYGNSLNTLSHTYQQGMAQIERDAADLKATGAISGAQNTAAFQQKLADAAFEAKQQALQLRSQKELAAYNARIQADKNRQQWDWQAQQDEYQAEREREMAILRNQLDYNKWLNQQLYQNNFKNAG